MFYELGLAHAFQKPVILLTQSIDDVPFDLKGYRLIEYNTHFLRIEEAKERLTTLAQGLLTGNTIFGSPVTDFYQSGNEPIQTSIPAVLNETESADDRGFIDHLIDLNEAYTHISEIVVPVASDLEDMTKSMEVATKDLEEIASSPSDSSPAAIRNVCRRFAQRISLFNDHLHQANSEYAAAISQVSENSIEFIVAYSIQHDTSDIEEQLSSLRTSRESMISARDSLLGFANTMDQLPRIERHLNHEVTRGSHEVRTMADNIDVTIASLSRALPEQQQDN